MTDLVLKTKKRTILGKKVKILRRDGFLPAVIYPVKNTVPDGVYGGEAIALPLVISSKDFENVLKKAGETTLVKLEIEGETKPRDVLIYDVLKDPISSRVIHVDFYQINMDEKIITKVPLTFVGKSPAVDDLGGILVKAMQELEIRTLPANLPHDIAVDISRVVTFEDNILVKNINAPQGVEILENPETPIASVVPPRSEEELSSLSGEVAEKIEEVKVEAEETAAKRAEVKAESKEAATPAA